jgi:hypothetical protein
MVECMLSTYLETLYYHETTMLMAVLHASTLKPLLPLAEILRLIYYVDVVTALTNITQSPLVLYRTV